MIDEVKMCFFNNRYSHHTEVSTRVDESGNTITIFTCNICNKEFTNLKFCKLHMVNHLVEPKRTDKINTIKATFDVNFNLYQAVKQDGFTQT